MKAGLARFLAVVCLYASAVLLPAQPAGHGDRDSQLQDAFAEFPLLSQATNSLGQPVFQTLSLTNPIVLNYRNFYGFRFTVPPRAHQEDFAWAMVKPGENMEWYILPQTGTMAGFQNYSTAFKGDFTGTNQLWPLDRDKIFLQGLAGDSLEDGRTYLIWFTFTGKTRQVSVDFTFASLGKDKLDRLRPLEKALGFSQQNFSAPVVNPNNHHSYILLKPGTWKNAEAAAVKLGGHLTTVRNQAEQDWLFQTFGNYGGARRLLWIGLSDRDKKFHFTWSSGESVSYTHWAKGEPNNTGRGEDFVAVYYPRHDQAGQWNDWNDRTHDPVGLPICGVVEIIPQNPPIKAPPNPSLRTTAEFPETNASSVPSPSISLSGTPDTLVAIQINPSLIITNDSGAVKLEWAISQSHYTLEATTNLNEAFGMFGYSEQTNTEGGFIYVTITNPVPQMFFRLRKP